ARPRGRSRSAGEREKLASMDINVSSACQRREDRDESLLRGLLQRRLLRLLLAAMGAEEPGPPTLTELPSPATPLAEAPEKAPSSQARVDNWSMSPREDTIRTPLRAASA